MKIFRIVLCVLGASSAVFGGDLDQDGIEDSRDACPRSPANVPVDETGRPWGDFDRDCDVDLSDIARILKSFTGPLPNVLVNECSQNPQACETSSSACVDTEYGYTCECFGGQSDCDNSLGCELVHYQPTNFCQSATNLGTFCGDTWTGNSCMQETQFVERARRTGHTSAWFRVTALGCNFCSTFGSFPLLLRVQLLNPGGARYHLFVHNSCGSLYQEAECGADFEEVDARAGSGHTGEFWIEVRFVGGASCEPWTLIVEGSQ